MLCPGRMPCTDSAVWRERETGHCRDCMERERDRPFQRLCGETEAGYSRNYMERQRLWPEKETERRPNVFSLIRGVERRLVLANLLR